jgi:hypothetical protein
MNGLNYYDFHARWMDNAVPGFISPDPLAENHYYESPYAYCGGNPVSRTDPRGLDWYWNKSSDIPTWFEGNKKQNGFQHHKSSLSRRFGMTVVLFKEDGSQEALLPEFDVTPYFSQVNYPLFYGMNNDTQEVFKTEEGEGRNQIGQKSTWDIVTNTRISGLDSRLRIPATDFINAAATQGVNLRITQGFRTFAEQDAFYAQGRTTQGEIITNAKGGESYHNYGLAFDVVIMQNGKPVWQRLPNNIGDLGASFGFEWGGNWRTFKDYPHFQMTFGQSFSDLQKK